MLHFAIFWCVRYVLQGQTSSFHPWYIMRYDPAVGLTAARGSWRGSWYEWTCLARHLPQVRHCMSSSEERLVSLDPGGQAASTGRDSWLCLGVNTPGGEWWEPQLTQGHVVKWLAVICDGCSFQMGSASEVTLLHVLYIILLRKRQVGKTKPRQKPLILRTFSG